LALRAVTTVENGILLNNNKDKTIKFDGKIYIAKMLK